MLETKQQLNGSFGRGFLVAIVAAGVFLFPVNVSHSSRLAHQIKAKSGETVTLRAYYRYRWRDCKSLKVTVKVIKEPENGKLLRASGYRDPYDADLTAGSGRCTGTRIRSVEFRYRSKSGFKGKDHVILRPIGFGAGTNHHFRITVE